MAGGDGQVFSTFPESLMREAVTLVGRQNTEIIFTRKTAKGQTYQNIDVIRQAEEEIF